MISLGVHFKNGFTTQFAETHIQHFQMKRKIATRENSPKMSQKPMHISDNLCSVIFFPAISSKTKFTCADNKLNPQNSIIIHNSLTI